ncbi:MAG: PASTA domain-containing protein, partial [Candidatus Sulfotelmatobacter sp.]
TKDKDLEEGTPDHPGEPLETADVSASVPEPAVGKTSVARAPSPAAAGGGQVVQAAIRQNEPTATPSDQSLPANAISANDSAAATKTPTTGTVVLDIEQGGIEVPSFVGKTVRGAVESAEDAGLNLEAVGSGVGRQQSPPAGTHVAAGAHVTVQFGR